MQKQSIQYDSPLDALVAIAKRLSRYETEAGLSSEDFFNRFSQGAWRDDAQAVEWANDYRHYLALRAQSKEINAFAQSGKIGITPSIRETSRMDAQINPACAPPPAAAAHSTG